MDDLMVLSGLASDRKNAFALILSGLVIVDDQCITEASTLLPSNCKIRVRGRDRGKFVGRGALKIESAFIHFNMLDLLKGIRVLDVGASTGGFTQVCLLHGALEIWAVDVGVNQLAWSLRQDARVKSVEKTDIRDFVPPGPDFFDLVVCDASFISLATILPTIKKMASKKGCLCLLLIKPQFEIAKDKLPKGAIVSDQIEVEPIISRIGQLLESDGFTIDPYFPSPVKGRSGNQEFFLLAKNVNFSSK